MGQMASAHGRRGEVSRVAAWLLVSTLQACGGAAAPDGSSGEDAGELAPVTGADAEAGTAMDASTAMEASADASSARSCKRGVAYNRERAGDAKGFGSRIRFWYDWDAAPDSAALAARSAAQLVEQPAARGRRQRGLAAHVLRLSEAALEQARAWPHF